MMKFNQLKYICLFILIPIFSFTQNKIDSLENILSNSQDYKHLDILFELSNNYSIKGENDKAKEYLKRSISVCDAIGNNPKKAEALSKLARLNYLSGNLTNAIIFNFDALEIIENSRFYQNQFEIYTNLGDIYLTLNDYEKSYYFYKSAFKLTPDLNNNALVLSADKICNFYISLNVIDSAEKYVSIAEEIHTRKKIRNNIELTLNARASIFSTNKEYNKALDYYNKSIEECKMSNNFFLLSENYLTISKIYLNQNNLKLAEKNLEKSASIINEYSLLNRYELYSLYAILNEKTRQYKKAFDYHKRYIALKDSTLNSPTTKKVATLKNTIEYNALKDFIYQLENDISFKALFIKKQKNSKAVLVIAVFFLMVILSLYFMLYKNKLKANKILHDKNEEIQKKNIEIKQKTENLTKVNKELEKLSIAASKTDNAIIITKPNGDIEWINEGYTRLYGYTWEEFLQEKGNTYFETSSNPNIKEIFNRALTEKKTQMYEAEFESKNGKLYYIHTTLSPILNNQNEIVKLIAIDSDVTKQKQVEKELQELLVTKDKFFSIIAHDLKNPFNSLMGISQLLVHGYDRLTPEKVKYFHTNLYQISKNGYELLINLLEWSRSQMGTIQFKPAEISLAALVEETFSLYNAKAAQKEITLTNEIPEDSEILADQNMIKTIIRNLVSNALKFTERGGAIAISEKSLVDYKEITVRDTGIGIEPEILNKLFKLDENYTSEGTEDETGTGLGLILCKEFVEKHGGKIKVESKVGFGSKFIFTLPS